MKAQARKFPGLGPGVGGKAKAAAMGRTCDHPGCTAEGEHKAPRDRLLSSYYWFCLEHVRDYNKSWNFYLGMTEEEIEMQTRRDTTWQRPTWPLGGLTSKLGRDDFAKMKDRFGVFDEDRAERARQARSEEMPVPIKERQAMTVMNLDPPLSMGPLKARYKELVKLHHPDRHGGSKEAEEKLKVINEAYTTLKKSLQH